MTKTVLLKKLIKHYTESALKLTEENWKDKIWDLWLDDGVCRIAKKVFNVYISDWVEYWCRFDKTVYNSYWIKPHDQCSSYVDLLENIETRICIMLHELHSGIKDWNMTPSQHSVILVKK